MSAIEPSPEAKRERYQTVEFIPTEDNPYPAKGAIRLSEDTWLVPPGRGEISRDARVIQARDIDRTWPERRDLPPSHPYYGRHMARNLSAGYPGDLECENGELFCVLRDKKQNRVKIAGNEGNSIVGDDNAEIISRES